MLFVSPSLPATSDTEPSGWRWAWVDALQQNAQQGQGLPDAHATLPHCVLVVPGPLLSWHTLALPRTSSGKLRPVLEGLLEDRLLDEPGQLHFALAPDHKHGVATDQVWVATCQRAWLLGCLQRLAAAGLTVTRVLPGALPMPQQQTWLIDDGALAWLTRMGPEGVLQWPLPTGAGARGASTGALGEVPGAEPTAVNQTQAHACFATPATVQQAEQLFPHHPWQIQPLWRLWVELAQSGWDLAQFDIRLSAGARREQSFKALIADWVRGPQWKPLRWGLLALVVLHVAGLNAVAAQQRAALLALQDQVRLTVTDTFPQITLVLDAPVQMQRELVRLRQGRNAWTEQDLESVLERLGRVVDAHSVSLHSIDYTPERVRLVHTPFNVAARTAMVEAFQSTGWLADFTAEGTELTFRGGNP